MKIHQVQIGQLVRISHNGFFTQRMTDTRAGNHRFSHIYFREGRVIYSLHGWFRPNSNWLVEPVTEDQIAAAAAQKWADEAPAREAAEQKEKQRNEDRARKCQAWRAKFADQRKCFEVGKAQSCFTEEQIRELSFKDRINADGTVTLGSHTRYYGTYSPGDLAELMRRAGAEGVYFREFDRAPDMESHENRNWIKQHHIA